MLLFEILHKELVINDIQKMPTDQNNHSRNVLLQQFRFKSDFLTFQLTNFKNLIRDRKMINFYETKQTRQLVLRSRPEYEYVTSSHRIASFWSSKLAWQS
jgi:hypothetical protein